MAERFEEQSLRGQLSSLQPSGLVMFALSCAERMLPNYRRFVREHGWGNETALRAALDLGWRWLEQAPADAEIAESIREVCEEQAPNTEDFATISVSSALDAANAAAIVAGLVVEPDVEKVIELASYARDSVDMFVQELEQMPPGAPDLEERIRLHPLMQRELVNQREAIESILSGITVESAAERWRQPEFGSLDTN
jgi:uncharacterized protein YjaG (DUF416 family)